MLADLITKVPICHSNLSYIHIAGLLEVFSSYQVEATDFDFLPSSLLLIGATVCPAHTWEGASIGQRRGIIGDFVARLCLFGHSIAFFTPIACFFVDSAVPLTSFESFITPLFGPFLRLLPCLLSSSKSVCQH